MDVRWTFQKYTGTEEAIKKTGYMQCHEKVFAPVSGFLYYLSKLNASAL